MSELFIVDAFTDQLFAGNPAAVVLDRGLCDEQMQAIATENNLSETAFIKPWHGSFGAPAEQPARYAIRWFSPLTEIDFCGHATLAAAFALYQCLGLRGEIVFTTAKVGELRVRQNDNGRILMDFPCRPAHT